ncbi:MAG: transposase, partial [Kiloniellales bacterium]
DSSGPRILDNNGESTACQSLEGSPMQTECTPALFEFEPVERQKVVAGFDGGLITSDVGGLLLGQLDRGLRLIQRMAACFTDRRDPRLLEHRRDPGRPARVGLALGYDDLNDHDEPRHDPVFAVLAGKLEAKRSDCAPVAGKSTLNRLEHTPKPKKAYPLASGSSKYGPAGHYRFGGQTREIAAKPSSASSHFCRGSMRMHLRSSEASSMSGYSARQSAERSPQKAAARTNWR